MVLTYIVDKAELGDKNTFIELVKENISEDIGEKIMNFAEHCRQEGIQQGVQQGVQQEKIKIAVHLLAENLDVVKVAAITGLTLEEVTELKQKPH